MRSGRSALVIVIGVIMAVAVGVAAWHWGGGSEAPRENEGREVADRFLSQIQQGELDAAWESTTADFKSDEGRESFRAHVEERPYLKSPPEFAGFEEITVHDLTRWKNNYRFAAEPAGTSVDVGVLISQENGQWRVDQLLAP